VTARQRWTLAATIIGSSMTFVDATVVNVGLPALQDSLQATMTQVQWVIEAYALFLGALVLVGGSIGDQFGRRRTFILGTVLFTVASMFCGLAPSVRALITGRIVQGIGAAFLVPASLAIITATFDDAERGRAIGTWSGFSAMTSAIGPVVGGWLIEHVSWRAIFFLNLPLALVVLMLSWRFMDESHDPSRGRRVDWIGAALAIFGFGGVVFGLLEWPGAGASARVVAAIALGVVSLAALPAVERRSASPMLPLTLFRSRAFTLANLLTLLLYAALAMVLFLVPLNLIQIRDYTATAAGAAFLPFPLIMFSLSRWSGGLVATMGSRIPLSVGPVVAACGLAWFAKAGTTGSYWTTFFPAVVILGLGMAITVAPLTTTVMNAVEAEHAGVASGVNNAVARVAGLLAIAVFGLALTRAFDAEIGPRLDRLELTPAVRSAVDQQLPKMAGADLDSNLIEAPRLAAVREAIDESFVSAFGQVMIAVAIVALASGVVGLAIR
jgi:EmrB/QacA subfamily drug resistance transporter